VIIPVATATTIAAQPALLQPADPAVVINPLATLPSTYLPGDKHIVVNITEQHLYAYQGDTLAFSFTISSGADNSTSIGTFSVLDKDPLAYSAPWGFWMPDWLGIYWVGDLENGIHALPVLPDGRVIWGDSIGTPASHGCVVLDTADARLLYDWADIGTQVVIER
jgi:lipoprotein-anchoring transpeptidase ErfK/SrfK